MHPSYLLALLYPIWLVEYSRYYLTNLILLISTLAVTQASFEILFLISHTYHEDFDWKTGKGRPYSYYTYGSVVTQVEIDCLSGSYVVIDDCFLNFINPFYCLN